MFSSTFQVTDPTAWGDLSVLEPVISAQNDQPPTYTDQGLPVEDSAHSIAPPQYAHWEYHGPGSYLSVCSKPGVEWVAKQYGKSDFSHVSQTMGREISDKLRLNRFFGSGRVPPPDEETAWCYSALFFEQCPVAEFGLIDRADFDTLLQAHYYNISEKPSVGSEAVDCYAIVHTILAFGARIRDGCTEKKSTFVESSQSASRYYENALSALPDLLCCKTSLIAVQALILMVSGALPPL